MQLYIWGRLHKGSRRLLGHHFFIFYCRGLNSGYCWANGCFFDMLELQVTKAQGTPPSKWPKMAVFRLKMAIFGCFCLLSKVLLILDLILFVFSKKTPSDAFWTTRVTLLQTAKMAQMAILGKKWLFLNIFRGFHGVTLAETLRHQRSTHLSHNVRNSALYDKK